MSNPNIEATYGLAPAQEGMLFHSVLEAEGGFYVTQLTCGVRGADADVLVRAWQEVVNRHAIFRTAFAWKGVQKPLQVVGRRATLPVVQEDWRGRPEVERAAALEAWLEADRRKGFDLARAPLMRLALLRTGEAAWTLVWTHHHLLLDGWSLPRVLREVGEIYAALRAGRAVVLPLPRPYGEYVAWLGRQDLREAETFWRGLLDGVESATVVPAREGAAKAAAVVWGEVRMELTVEQTMALQTFARTERLTLNTLVQGAWAWALAAATGERDVIYGVTVSGRPAELPGVEEMIGLFINTLPMRTRIEPEQTVAAWLAELQRRLTEMRRFEHTPLVRVGGWAGRPAGQAPFEALFVFENYPVGETPAGAGSGTNFEIIAPRVLEKTNYPLTLVAAPGASLELKLAFDPARYDAVTVEHLMARLREALRTLPEAGARPLGELSLLAPAERSEILEKWNRTAVTWARPLTVPALFAESVARTPGAMAVVCDGRALTFAELDGRANALAGRLRVAGVRRGALVGICLERSVEMIVALLAVLKAGGAYVPLDPTFPPERLAMMLEDARPRVVLTQVGLREMVGKTEAEILLVDECDGEMRGDGGSIVAAAMSESIGAADLAYVLFTSGSTGRPKGVQVSHGALANVLLSFAERPGFGAGQTLLAVTTLSFDIAGLEIFLPLVTGGRLWLATREEATDGARLAETIARESVDVLQATPATWRLLVAAEFRAARGFQAWCGGEALPLDLAGELVARGCELWNVYGPTETTIWSLIQPVAAVEAAKSIGAGIANTTVYIVDDAGNPVPVGATGELLIGGMGVAEGYLGRADLTAEKFVPDAFGAVAGARLYRTGDRARWRADGTVEFLGRGDHQVKIRGFRIELGDIETALRRHAAVREAAVIVREDAPGEKRLVAYVVAAERVTVAVEALREFLAGALPDYMIPAAWVVLERLPLTPNRKLDRRALPAPEAGAGGGKEFVAARTADEAAVAGIWAGVLGVGRVGATDDFFALGGHSLTAMQVMARVRKELQVELPVRVVFEAATVEKFAQAVEAKREEVAGKKNAAGEVKTGTQARAESEPHLQAVIPQVQRGGAIPLSFAQERLWFLEQLAPGGSAYHMPAALELTGRLDVTALEKSFAALVRRHEALRTVFPVAAGRAAQQVRAAPETFALAVEDVGDEAAGRARLRAEVERAFDLERGPLLRARLLRLAPERHWLLVVVHHLISDGWSVGVMVRELTASYAAASAGRVVATTELTMQYGDYAQWQRTWLAGGVQERQLAYWTARLGGEWPALALPEDFARPAALSERGMTVGFALDAATTAALRMRARDSGASLFMAVLAGYAGFLARYTGQHDLVVGTPVANRPRPELEGVLGVFVNTLALRMDATGNPTFVELLARAKETALEAFARQDVPFEAVVEAVAPGRDLGRAPIFQTMLVLQNAPVAPVVLPGLTVAPLALENRAAKLDLTLTLIEGAAGLEGTWEFSTDLFTAETVARWSENFARLLAGVATEPAQVLSRWALASGDDAARLAESNATDTVYPETEFIHEQFVARAKATPDAVALAFEGTEMSYGELARRTEALARHLAARGVGTETLVGVCLERSFEMVVALMGILRAGAAYVPIDPEYPRERVAHMLTDSGVKVVLAQARFAELLGGFAGETVWLDRDWAQVEARQAVSDLPRVVAAEQAAYAIYTSGSTGRPKGAVNTHGGILNRLNWMQAAYGLTGADRVLQKTPFSFDVSVWEFFWPLMIGARLVLAQPGGHRDGAYLVELIRRERITTLHFVPSMLQAFLEEEEAGTCGTLRKVICSGEALPGVLRDRFFQKLDGAELHNLYGPTEAAVDVTYYACGKNDRGGNVPIGRPIANTQIHIVDTEGAATPVGAAGELWIGGVGLARGYVGRPDLTAEKFVPDPFATTPGARAYRTGDLARWRSDGEVEYLGRLDHQVKVRGFRIELGEIESVLAAHASVREVVVMARGAGGATRLAAYATARAGMRLDGAALRDWARAKLPDYMVPAAIVELAALPLLPNGKLDRKALPEPEWSAMTVAVSGGVVGPRSPEEQMLVEAWREVLGGETAIGIRDNFFERGGHSLLATRVMARVRRALGVELPLRALFEAPTIEGLAARIRAARAAGEVVELPPLVARANGAEAPLSFTQERLWFLEQLAPGRSTYHMPVALRLRGKLDVAALERSFVELVRRHEALRTVFRVGASGPVQVVLPEPEKFEIEVVGTAVIDAELRRPFTLGEELPIRARLVVRGADDYTLAVVMHHLVSDGWSIDVIVRELSELYAMAVAGRAAVLPALTRQYADFAAWQRAWLRGATLARQLEFWKKQLGRDGELPVLALPSDRARPPVWDGAGGHMAFQVPADVADGLRELGRREGTTLFMTLLAAYFAWLSRESGQDDFVVGTPVANRQLPETEGMVGFFVNTLAVRERVDGATRFRELLARVKADCLAAFAHQEVPFESVVEALAPARDLSRTPVYQTMFVLQHAAAAELRLPGLTVEPEAIENPTAKCELTLNLTERGRALEGTWEYGSALFAPETVQRWTESFGALLATLARAEAEVRVGELWRPPTAAAQKLFEEWQGRVAPAADLTPVPRQVARWVRETPDKIAMSDGREVLTYRELDARAAALARRLKSPGAEALVAVCLERSVEWVVALLAIWKAGSAYLPLDPRQPAGRLATMATDAGAACVVTRRERAEVFLGSACVCVDEPETGAMVVHTGAGREALSEELAYVIYTSGSTGRPKGVMISHSNLAQLVSWHRRAFGVTVADVATQLAGLGFDAAVWEVWPYLASGATLHLVPAETVASPAALRDFLVAQNVTISFLPTPLAEACLGQAWPATTRLRYMLTGGDRLHAAPPDQLPFVLVNNYGPTESTVVATSGPVTPGRGERAPTIGRPVDGTRVYVVDAWLNVVPPGAPGELCVAGGSLARGYLGRAELTAERFWPDPFSTEPGARLYRTGDLVRFDAGGELEFIGRVDTQVKIRGVRIEPAEIEAILQQEPDVAEAVVVARTARNGDARLIAYVVRPVAGTEPLGMLRERLKARLPEAMVPAQIVGLAALPFTPNGKVDRRALPVPAEDEGMGAGEFVAPQAGLEARIAAVWCEVLGRTKVGARDNFFDVGGHSLLILKMQIALQKILGREIPVVELFAHPTVAAQAARFGGVPVVEKPDEKAGTAARAAQQRAARERFKPAKR